MNIYLIGFRGSGKTTLGKKISEIEGMPYIDMDELIVKKVNMSIPEIFKNYGMSFFRKTESEVLMEISKKDNQVVSTGGGVVIEKENREILNKTGYCVYLYTSPEITYERIKDDDNRPALTNNPLKKEIKEIIRSRKPLYRELADFTIDTGKESINDCVKTIIEKIKNHIEV